MACKYLQSNIAVKWLENGIVRTWQFCLKLTKGRRRNAHESQSSRILITKTCCFGDAILSLYALRAFKQKYPEKSIHVLCSRRISSVYQSAAFIDKIFTLPVSGKNLMAECLHPRFISRVLRLVYDLKKEKYGLLFDFELYHGYPVILKSLLAIPQSIGFEVPGSYLKRHDGLVFRAKETAEWRCYYHLLNCAAPSGKPEPLYPPPKKTKGKKVGVVFGSSFNWPQKKWPLAYFKQTIRALALKGYQIVLFGVSAEKAESEELMAVAPRQIKNTVGQLAYTALIQELHGCQMVFGNDTGTMHLAAACNIPVVTLFGPTQEKKWNAITSHPISIEIKCRPCYYLSAMPDCPHLNCLNHLKPEQVLGALFKQLEHAS